MNGEHTVRGIPESSRSNRLWIVLLKDLGDYALYFNRTDNHFSGFEVHKIRIKEAQESDIKRKDGSVYHLSGPRRRVLAGSEEFGRYAWHFPSLDLVFENHPEFKKYAPGINSKLEYALITCLKRVSRDDVDKITRVGSKPSVSKSKSDVTARNGMSVVLCKYCNYPNRILKGVFGSSYNKGEKDESVC